MALTISLRRQKKQSWLQKTELATKNRVGYKKQSSLQKTELATKNRNGYKKQSWLEKSENFLYYQFK